MHYIRHSLEKNSIDLAFSENFTCVRLFITRREHSILAALLLMRKCCKCAYQFFLISAIISVEYVVDLIPNPWKASKIILYWMADRRMAMVLIFLYWISTFVKRRWGYFPLKISTHFLGKEIHECFTWHYMLWFVETTFLSHSNNESVLSCSLNSKKKFFVALSGYIGATCLPHSNCGVKTIEMFHSCWLNEFSSMFS